MKIAIIGAGICGLYLAWKLAEKGEEVTVFEKRKKIGKEACSGLFSERILDFIPSESQKLIQNQINSTLIHFPRRTLKVRFAKRFFVMDHFKLDNLVARLSQKAGVKIILNNPINSLPGGFDRIIGCDGPLSTVRKILGINEPNYRLAIQGFISQKDSCNYVETWPTQNGFIWRIPRGEKVEEDKSSSSPFANAWVTEYGILEESKRAKILFDQFLKKNNLLLEGINSALVPQGLSISKNEMIALCGDAAGLTKPWSGGGVIWGLLAADLLLKNFPDFLKYQKETKKFFLPKIIFSKIATKMVYFLGFNIPWLIPKNVKIEGDFLI